MKSTYCTCAGVLYAENDNKLKPSVNILCELCLELQGETSVTFTFNM